MKILYHHRIASKDGQYVHVEELTNALVELGHEIRFIAPEFSKKTDFGNDGGFIAKLKKALPHTVYELLELSYSLIIAVKLVKGILQFKPDFIYERYNLYQPAGVIIAKIFRIPLFLEVNAPLVDERSKYSGLSLVGLARFIENFTWRNADYVLPVTDVLANILIQHGTPEEKVRVIHNGINENLLDSVFSEKDTMDNKRIVIGFVGFINPWHRIDLALDAISSHKNNNIELVCIGEGDIRHELERKAEMLGITDKVTFTGLLERTEVFIRIQHFDIALQPSVTPYASPLKMFEYLAASCLIIAPKAKNILEIIDDSCAILFEENDFDDFSLKLAYAIENYHTLRQKRQNARWRIYQSGFTWQENARRILNLAGEYDRHKT